MTGSPTQECPELTSLSQDPRWSPEAFQKHGEPLHAEAIKVDAVCLLLRIGAACPRMPEGTHRPQRVALSVSRKRTFAFLGSPGAHWTSHWPARSDRHRSRLRHLCRAPGRATPPPASAVDFPDSYSSQPGIPTHLCPKCSPASRGFLSFPGCSRSFACGPRSAGSSGPSCPGGNSRVFRPGRG